MRPALSSAASRVGWVIERASVQGDEWEITDEDQADVDDLLHGLARFVDKNIRRERELGVVPHTTAEALPLVAQAFAGEDLGDGTEAAQVFLAGVVEILAGLDPHEFATELARIGDAARECGIADSRLRVHLARGAVLLAVCHDKDLLEPLLQYPALIRGWVALLWELADRHHRLERLSRQHGGDDRDPAGDALGAEPEETRERRPPPATRPAGRFCRRHPVRRHAPPGPALVQRGHVGSTARSLKGHRRRR